MQKLHANAISTYLPMLYEYVGVSNLYKNCVDHLKLALVLQVTQILERGLHLGL